MPVEWRLTPSRLLREMLRAGMERMMKHKRKAFKASELHVVANAESFQHGAEGPLLIGDVVNFNSGSPPMMVVDYDGPERVIAAWRDDDGAVQESDFHRACLHRVPLA